MMSLPLISIITPSFNRADMIADAIESVLAQNDPAFENIIIDGGSTDGTLGVLARYPHLRVVSESDRGMYDALNKGLRMARAAIIGLLNTDDRFAPGCLAAVRAAFDRHPTEVAVVGGLLYEQDGQIIRTRPAPDLDQFLKQAGRFAVNFPNGWFCRIADGAPLVEQKVKAFCGGLICGFVMQVFGSGTQQHVPKHSGTDHHALGFASRHGQQHVVDQRTRKFVVDDQTVRAAA